MSDDKQLVDQITKEPSAAPIGEKDPKRVAAGKVLAEKNKQMREEYAKFKATEAESNERMRKENERYKATEEERLLNVDSGPSDGFLSQLTFANVFSLVGVGLTIYVLFFRGEEKPKVSWKEPVETTFERQEEKTSKAKPKAVETKNRPKYGM